MLERTGLTKEVGIQETLSYSQRIKLTRELGARGVFNDAVQTTVEFDDMRDESMVRQQVQQFLDNRVYIHEAAAEIITRR